MKLASSNGLLMTAAQNIRDFCPISLAGSVYKILPNLLANRAILITIECLDSRLKYKILRMIAKLDMERSYIFKLISGRNGSSGLFFHCFFFFFVVFTFSICCV
jgi:hypothetical protein